MVEIIPYTEDDEDQSNWIPLTSTATPTNATYSTANHSSVAAAVITDNASAVSAARTNVVNFDPNDTIGNLKVGRGNKGSREDLIFVEDVEDESDDGNEWQTLSSKSASQLQHSTTQTLSSATEPSWSWGKQLITHLTSTPTTATTSVTEVDDDDASENEEDIVWSRPNDLGGDVDVGGLYCSNRQSSIEEEYDDEKISAMKIPSQKLFTKAESIQQLKEPLQTKPQIIMDTHESQEEEEEQARFQRIPEQQRKHEQTQPNPSAKTKLQQKFIHDPLRAIPLCFLRHLYHETKLRFTLAWDTYLEQNELQSILAPLSLLIIVGLLGMGLIGTGLSGLGSLILRASVQVIVSFYTWMVELYWAMASKIVWISICASLVLVIMIWIWSRVNARRDEATKPNNDKSALKAFQVPSTSTLLPWAVAFSSPSLYEVFIIILSLRTCISIITPRNRVEECFSLSDTDGSPSCLEDMVLDQPISSGMSTLAIGGVALLLVAMNALAIAVAANMLEKDGNQKCGSVEDTSDGKAVTRKPSSTGSPELPSTRSSYTFVKSFNQIRRYIVTCHTISVLSLAILSISILLVQKIYMHYIGNVLFGLGTIGCNIVCIGLGIFILVTLWNITTNAVTGNDSVFATRISYGDISRKALKKSIMEVSSSAVWGSDGSLGGILSDDDGTLRFAILEWLIDRWTMSSDETKSQPTVNFSSPAANDSNKNSNNDGSDHNSFPNSNHAGSKESNSSTSTSDHQTILPSYQSLQRMCAKLDADATLIPTIERYRAWVYSLPPSRNAAMYVALWKMCPATAVLGLAALWCIGWSVIGRLFLCLSWLLGPSSQIANTTNENDGGWLLFMFMCTILSPVLYLEYQRVRLWWAKTTSHLKNMDYDEQSSNEPMQKDLVMILLRADTDDLHSQSAINAKFCLDTSSLLLRIWLLLLESIAVLESSIPVVRCATVASAAADLTNDTICLVDLGLEIKKKGLIGGMWMFVSDAFQYHLSKELEQRKQETDDASSDQARERRADDHEDLGGQYTGAVVSAVENLGKMSHNITCLMGKNHPITAAESNSEHDSKI